MRFYHGITILALTCGTPILADDGAYATGSVMIEPIGFAVYPIPSRGVEIALNTDGEDAVSVSYAAGEHSRLLTKYHTELALVRYRWTLGSMSHLHLGFGSRGLRQTYAVQRDDGSSADLRAETHFFALESSFGSHLRIGPIRFSCDWLGFVLPISNYRQKTSTPDGIDPSEQEENNDALERAAWVPTLQLLRLSTGVVF